jgi:hypothetical protein
MGFLSKKSMLVSLLALSLAACATTRTIPPTSNVDLPCDGDAGSHKVATTIKFEIAPGSTCTLKDVDFIQDEHGNSKHLKKTKPATSSDPTVVFTYDGSSALVGDGAFFYYKTHSPKGDGGGGGIIK